MLIVRGIMWISVLIVMLICMVKTKRNGMKKKIRALIFVVFLFILFVFMPYSTEAPIETPTEAPVPTVEISPTEAALEENTEETDWFNDFDNRDSEETDWFDDWNYDENGNKVN